MLKKKEKEQADKLLGKFLLWNDIPFSVVRNNPFFQPVVDAIAIVGLGYKSLLMMTLEGTFFKMKMLTAPRDWRSLGHHGHTQDAL